MVSFVSFLIEYNFKGIEISAYIYITIRSVPPCLYTNSLIHKNVASTISLVFSHQKSKNIFHSSNNHLHMNQDES